MPLWLRIARRSLGVVAFAALLLGPAQAATLRLNARTIFERAVTSNITLSPDGSALQLKSGEVFQDDGPASGFSYKLNNEKLSPGIEIRKQLLIPDPRASKAVLMVGPRRRPESGGERQPPETRSAPRDILRAMAGVHD